MIGAALGVLTILAATEAGAQPRWGRPSFPQDGACFYRDKNYGGDYFCTTAGQDIAVLPNGMNDQISSIRTFGNVEVTIYREGRFRGRSAELRGDVRNVGGEWNDVISSVRVNRGNGYGFGNRGIGIDRRGEGNDRRGDGNDRRGDGNDRRGDENDRRGNGNDRGNDRDNGRRAGNRTWTDQEAEAMVARAYRSVLGRDPDPASRGWVDQVKSNHWSEEQLINELKKSAEYIAKHKRDR